jgi:hypothetical protein
VTPLTLTLPMPPNIGNGSHGHWRTRHRQKTEYLDTLALWYASKLIPHPPAKPMYRAGITATFYVGARMDTDNLFRRAKWPIDWLVRCGYVSDDRDDRLVWQEIPKQVIERGQRYRIDFTLTPLTPSPDTDR